MESWRTVWRECIAPLLKPTHLAALKTALETDDPFLIQGTTTSPPPDTSEMECKVEAACALGYCGWRGDGLESVGEVEAFFSALCFEIDQKLGEPAGCRWFLNWFDDTPREEMRRELLAEIHLLNA